jgi:hypothetical protein
MKINKSSDFFYPCDSSENGFNPIELFVKCEIVELKKTGHLKTFK